MHATIKINNITLFENIQGVLIHEIAEYVEIVRGSELSFETVEIDPKGFAKFLASRHTAIVENGFAILPEKDVMYYESHRVLTAWIPTPEKTIAENFNNATMLFCIPVEDIETLTVEIN